MTDIEATALALQATLQSDPKDPRAVDIARWLMKNRRENHWISTRDTAFVLYAVSDYLKHSKELQPDYGVTLTVNGHMVRQVHHH